MFQIPILLDTTRLPPTAMAVALVCALCGTAVLALFTRRANIASLLLSVVVLFAGAFLANLLTAGWELRLERFYIKPILMSFIGMSVSSLLVLALFARNRNTD